MIDSFYTNNKDDGDLNLRKRAIIKLYKLSVNANNDLTTKYNCY